MKMPLQAHFAARRSWTAKLRPLGWGAALLLALACPGSMQDVARAQPALPPRYWNRPAYIIDANVDFNLLTVGARERAIVPATPDDPLSSAAFFLYANANGIGGADERHHNLEVDSVTMGGAPVPWRLDGAVLHVATPAPETAPFEVDIAYHGIVPRAPEGAAEDMMGGLGSDLSGLLGGLGGAGAQAAPAKPKNTDYGLYTYGDDILSLSAFWYAQLAVRENGRWADQPPSGLGDVGYSEKSDFQVAFHGLPDDVIVAAPGVETAPDVFRADNVREFAATMSDQYVVNTGTADILGRPVPVTAYTLRKDAATAPKALDVAIHALEIYSRRFGPYEFGSFKVVEAPLRGGAGGMEYSSIVSVAEMLYGDMAAKMGGMISGMNIPGADKMLKSLEGDAGGDGGAPAAAPNVLPDAGAQQGDDGAGAGGAGGMADAVGGLLQQQDEILKTLFEESLAHEVGHQWWCIAVGSDSENHPFLDESLTNWSSMLYWEDRYGKATAAKMIDLHLKSAFTMGIALGGGDKPANLPSDAYTNNLQYGAVIYGKAAIFYAKLRDLVGDDAYFAALRDYYANYRDRLAGPDDLHHLMVARAPDKRDAIDALYQHWINEAHGQEDLGSGTLGGIDLTGMLQSLLGGNLGNIGNLGDLGQ